MAQIVEIVAIGVAACDGENASTQDIRHRMRDLGRVTSVRDQPGQRVDQAKTLVGGGLLLAYVGQRERKQGIVVGGGHGRFCPELESGVSTQSLSDSRWLYHARLRIPAMQ